MGPTLRQQHREVPGSERGGQTYPTCARLGPRSLPSPGCQLSQAQLNILPCTNFPSLKGLPHTPSQRQDKMTQPSLLLRSFPPALVFSSRALLRSLP